MIDGVHSIAWHAAVLRAECENCRHRRSTLKGHASRTFERHVLHEVLNPRPHAVELGRTLIDLKMAVRIDCVPCTLLARCQCQGASIACWHASCNFESISDAGFTGVVAMAAAAQAEARCSMALRRRRPHERFAPNRAMPGHGGCVSRRMCSATQMNRALGSLFRCGKTRGVQVRGSRPDGT